MTDQIFVRPALGRIVRDPATTRVIDADGQHIADSIFIRRRIADGDLIIVDEPLPPAA